MFNAIFYRKRGCMYRCPNNTTNPKIVQPVIETTNNREQIEDRNYGFLLNRNYALYFGQDQIEDT
jgi:hypothetical protein